MEEYNIEKKIVETQKEYKEDFLKYVDDNSSDQSIVSNNEIFLIYGPIGLVIWLVLVYFLWFNRKKESVKKSVFDRQIKPIN